MAELAMLADIKQTVYPKEVTHQLHVIVQARESSPVIDQRSNHCATPPTNDGRLAPSQPGIQVYLVYLNQVCVIKCSLLMLLLMFVCSHQCNFICVTVSDHGGTVTLSISSQLQ